MFYDKENVAGLGKEEITNIKLIVLGTTFYSSENILQLTYCVNGILFKVFNTKIYCSTEI